MPRRSNKPPKTADPVTKYNELEELLSAFASGDIPLLVVVGRSGLGKSRSIRRAIGTKEALVIKGRKSALDFYLDLYAHKDKPVILDDAEDLMGQRLCRDYVKALTETEDFRRLDYGTRTRILAEEDVPPFFWTKSNVAVITNHWTETDPIFVALESRAEFIYFDPDWAEVYREVGKWFWDQEIFDYVGERLDSLREPDVRLYLKAYNRKKAGLSKLGWRRLIDAHVDDKYGLAVRRLLDDKSHPSNTARAEAFIKETEADRATFYRRLKQIKRYRPGKKPRRIVLKTKSPPQMDRPTDGKVIGDKNDAEVVEQPVPTQIIIPFRPKTKPRQVVRKPK